MKIGPFDANTVDDCLWREVPKEERTRLVERLERILALASDSD
jgi:hypothetical protein